jgi:hypothetical protein
MACIRSNLPTGFALVWMDPDQHCSSRLKPTTHKPVPTSHRTPCKPYAASVPKREHEQLALGHDDEELLPLVLLGPLARALPVLLVLEHAFLCPRGAEKGQLVVVHLIEGREGCVRVHRRHLILVLPDNGVGQVGCETERSGKRSGGLSSSARTKPDRTSRPSHSSPRLWTWRNSVWG